MWNTASTVIIFHWYRFHHIFSCPRSLGWLLNLLNKFFIVLISFCKIIINVNMQLHIGGPSVQDIVLIQYSYRMIFWDHACKEGTTIASCWGAPLAWISCMKLSKYTGTRLYCKTLCMCSMGGLLCPLCNHRSLNIWGEGRCYLWNWVNFFFCTETCIS